MTYTYDLKKIGFTLIRSKKHETWHKILEDGTVYYIRVSHKGNKTIPKWLFSKMLKQAGISREEFEKILGRD